MKHSLLNLSALSEEDHIAQFAIQNNSAIMNPGGTDAVSILHRKSAKSKLCLCKPETQGRAYLYARPW